MAADNRIHLDHYHYCFGSFSVMKLLGASSIDTIFINHLTGKYKHAGYITED